MKNWRESFLLPLQEDLQEGWRHPLLAFHRPTLKPIKWGFCPLSMTLMLPVSWQKSPSVKRKWLKIFYKDFLILCTQKYGYMVLWMICYNFMNIVLCVVCCVLCLCVLVCVLSHYHFFIGLRYFCSGPKKPFWTLNRDSVKSQLNFLWRS